MWGIFKLLNLCDLCKLWFVLMMIEFLDILWIKQRKNYSFSWHFFFSKRLRTLKINRVIKKLKFLNLKITEFLFSAFTSRKKCLKRPNYLGICDHVHVSVCVYVCVCAQHKKTSGGLSACLHRCPVSNWKLHFWIGFISNTAICHSGRYSTGRMSAALKKVSVAVLWNPSSIHS